MTKVMICDDALFMRMALKKILIAAGFKVVGEAENGKIAVGRYQELRPDVVLMDITMPEMDGMAALKAIRQSSPEAAVIMCTAIGQEQKVMEALLAGAKDYIIKPFKPEKVIEAVKKAGNNNG